MEESKNLEKNLKRFPIYKMFAWDLLFYYAIIFIFLIKAKRLTASQILFADAFYPIFKFILEMLCISFSNNIGRRKSILVGNIFINSAILFIILCKDIKGLIFANFLLAIGYNLKEISEPPFLNGSIENKEKRREIFSRIEGNSNSKFYFFDAICSASAGFLFTFNYYLPMIFCLLFSVIGTLISLSFEEIENSNNSSSSSARSKNNSFFKDFKYMFSHIFKSQRLKCLIFYAALFTSLLAVFKTYMNSLFVDLNLPDVYFGLITAGIQIVSAFSSKSQNFFHKKYRNRTLTLFALPLCISMIITGLVVICNLHYYFAIFAIAIMILFYAVFKGPYFTLIKRYLNSFVASSVSTKIYSANSMCESIFRSITYLLSSYLLHITSTAFAIIILGSIFTLAFILLLDYMKTRVGLRPEMYGPSDIKLEIH